MKYFKLIFFWLNLILSHCLFAQTPLNFDILEVNQSGAEIGISTSNAGDINGDGYDDIIGGAYFYDNGQSNEGGAFVYYGSSIGINPVPAAILESDQANASFGISVSKAGDVNGDGFGDIIIGANSYDNGQTNEGRVYIYLGSSDGINTIPATILELDQAYAYFGNSVSYAGDVNNDGYDDVVASAYDYDNGQTDEGRIYVFHGSPMGIDLIPEIILESNQASAHLGISVSCAGDVNNDGYDDIIAGAPDYDNGQSNEGRTFIYHGSAAGISPIPAINIELNTINQHFGHSVSGAGDINGDDYDDIIVGAYDNSHGQTGEGLTFIFYGSYTGIDTSVIDTIEMNQASAWLGYSVAGVNDINNDGFDDIITGAKHYSNGQTNEGTAFIYLGSADGLKESPLVPLECNQAYAYFGSSVSGGGDINGDGFSDIIIGAEQYDNGQSNEGGVFVYYGADCITQYFTDIDGDGYGNALSSLYSCEAPSGYITDSSDCNDLDAALNPETIWYEDGDLDSYYTGLPVTQCLSPGATFVISDITAGGDCIDSSSVSFPGAIEIIDGLDNNCDGATDENFDWKFGGLYGYIGESANSLGYSVSAAGDVNGDGYKDAIVGANFGRAFIFYGTSTGLSFLNVDTLSNLSEDSFGNSVSSAGDVNGDGFDDVIVGVTGFDNGQTEEGGAFIYHGSASGIITTPAVILESNIASTNFGYSVSSAGDINNDGYGDIVVGAYNYTNGQSKEGAAYIYYGSPMGLSIIPAAILENNLVLDHFGNAVAGAGDINGDGFDDVVIGAESGGFSNEGLIYFYKGSASGIITTPITFIESNEGASYFGHSVSTAGDVNNDGYSDVIVGAYKFQYGFFGEGKFYIYFGTSTGINTTPAAIRESGIAWSYLGCSVSAAGDINFDGFDDIIVGAYNHDDFEENEGKAFIYLGNALGISAVPDYAFECNQSSAEFGYSVSGVGDLNGDGLDDVVVGAKSFDKNASNEGAVFVYLNDACINTFYLDADGDGYGNPDIFLTSCTLPEGYSPNQMDCDDVNASVNPLITEICNTIDDNCNGLIDEDISVTISIAAGGPTTFCQGGNVLLTATYSGATVQWKKNGTNIPGATSPTYLVTTKGTYTCETSSACDTELSTGIFVNVQKNPPATITAGGPTTFCAGGSVILTANAGGGLSYQWYKGASLIAGATSINYTATISGNYKCRVTKTATGCFKNSNVIIVSVPCKEGVLTTNEKTITIAPNPNNGTFILDVLFIEPKELNPETATVEIYNPLSQLIFTQQLPFLDNAIHENISINNLAAGIYQVKIIYAENSWTQQLIIHN